LIDKDIKVGGSNKAKDIELSLFSNSKSTFLRPDQNLRAYYEDPTIQALKKSSTGILLSLLLSLSVIFCLIYLLKIISTQKELAEIKNDLINNITHEFKTPIATISTAIEAIESFNVTDNKEKTKQYAAISAFQLKKLHVMVEKLLETATLDSESLLLQKEPTNIVDLIAKIAKKFELLTKKEIKFTTNIDSKILKIDLFHFENAVSNLVDNAIKYGGDIIEININPVLNVTEISVADNGKGIDKSQQERIFDKFYRVPKGNTHDVKGFGIGLYYAQKIIEKHNGSINISSSFDNTIFKLQIPNE
jgi:two-component system phosphate regulon sensor histidine kinase PhoR